MGEFMKRDSKFIYFVVITILTCPVIAMVDYDPITLFQMLMKADIVVSGKITKVRAATYDLEVQQSFRPGEVSHVLTVQRIDDQPLASRWTEYAPGQEIVLFAKAGTGAEAPLTPLGAAGEGEVPSDAEAVYLPKLARTDRTLSSASVAGKTVTGYRVGIGEFFAAIEGFFRCFALVPRKTPDVRSKLERHCDNIELAGFRAESWFAEHLASIAERLIERGN